MVASSTSRSTCDVAETAWETFEVVDPSRYPTCQFRILMRRCERARIGDQDALGTEPPMDDLLVVGKTHDLRDLPHQLEARADAQSVSPLREEMIEPDRQGVVIEDEGGTEFVLGETVDAEDAGVLERLEQLKFPERRAFELPTVFRG